MSSRVHLAVERVGTATYDCFAIQWVNCKVTFALLIAQRRRNRRTELLVRADSIADPVE